MQTSFQCLDGRTSWSTLISAFRILVDTNDDRLYVAYNGGLQIVFEVIATKSPMCNVIRRVLIAVISKFTHHAPRGNSVPRIWRTPRCALHSLGLGEVYQNVQGSEGRQGNSVGKQGLVRSTEEARVIAQYVQSTGDADTLHRYV